MLILSISHHIYLTKEQRYALIDNDISVTGVSIPVWVKTNGMSTEPAVEVLCRYELTNVDKKMPIHFNVDGYRINMPQLSEHEKEVPRVSDDIWRSFSPDEKMKYYDNQNPRPCVEWLKDGNDGGSMHLQFREHNKIYQDEEALEIYHYIHINDESKLTTSLS